MIILQLQNLGLDPNLNNYKNPKSLDKIWIEVELWSHFIIEDLESVRTTLFTKFGECDETSISCDNVMLQSLLWLKSE
jgi:hypothetical protein